MIRVDPFAYLFCALLLLTLPFGWLLAALGAAVFHELCHIVMLHILGGRVLCLHIGIGGAVIEAELKDKRSELLCALAGPVGSILLFCTYDFLPKLAICAGVQGFFNLLPIFPLDGGRILRCALELLCPGKAEQIQNLTEASLLLGMAILAAVGTFAFSLGFMPLILSLTLILKAILRKRPCKQGENRVQ